MTYSLHKLAICCSIQIGRGVRAEAAVGSDGIRRRRRRQSLGSVEHFGAERQHDYFYILYLFTSTAKSHLLLLMSRIYLYRVISLKYLDDKRISGKPVGLHMTCIFKRF